MGFEIVLVLVIFFVTYALIISGKFESSIIAVSMGLLIILFKIAEGLTISNIGYYVDFNTLGILIGMMILVGILKTTGFFQFVAALIVKGSKGRMFLIYTTLLIFVAIFSSLLDNVTTILVFAPIIFLIADTARINPIPLIMSIVFAANIGGMATIIGDPPNILVGSAAGFSFVEFLLVMGIPSMLMFIVTLFYFRIKYSFIKKIPPSEIEKLMTIDPKKAIVNKPLFIIGIFTFCLVIAGFVLHETLDYEASVIALSGGILLMLFSGFNFSKIAHEIEWDTIFFFIGLFMLAKALEEVGIIEFVSNTIIGFSSTPLMLILAILWVSTFLGGFIGAVPVVTVFIPVINKLMPVVQNGTEMWWALALGASIGANLTISGSAVNMVAVGLIESNGKDKITFIQFFKQGLVITFIGLAIASVFLTVRWNFLLN